MIRGIKDFVTWVLFYSAAMSYAEYKDWIALERGETSTVELVPMYKLVACREHGPGPVHDGVCSLCEPPRLILSPRDAAMFVEHVARQRVEIETAKVFDGGASGCAGVSGKRVSPAEKAAEPVADGTLSPARAARNDEQ